MSYDPNELPDGWVMRFDSTYDHPFWVDSNANPPRAIWKHPYEDEQFLNEHPEIRDRLAKHSDAPSEAPPPYSARRHSFSGTSASGSSRAGGRAPVVSQPGTPATDSSNAHKRGFFGKLKDKAIGTKEEREEAKRQQALIMEQRAEQRRRYIEELRRQQRMSMSSRPGYQNQQQYGFDYGQRVYGAPAGSPFGYGGYSTYGSRQRYGNSGGVGGGNVALPLIGGLAGGLLLGDLLDGGFGGPGFF